MDPHATPTTTQDVTMHIVPTDTGTPVGKLADAELHFTGGPLDGLTLVGFAVWAGRGDAGRSVTLPARQYTVNGERRRFTLLRSPGDPHAQATVRELILAAYTAHAADA